MVDVVRSDLDTGASVPEASPMADQVILLLDGSHLAEHALPAATREAHRHAVPLTLLRPVTCPTTPEDARQHGGPIPGAGTCTAEVLDPLQAEAASYVGRLREGLRGSGMVHAVARVGNPLQVVWDEVALHRAPIVMVPFSPVPGDVHHGLTETLVMLGQHLIRHGGSGRALIQPVLVEPDPTQALNRGEELPQSPASHQTGVPPGQGND